MTAYIVARQGSLEPKQKEQLRQGTENTLQTVISLELELVKHFQQF